MTENGVHSKGETSTKSPTQHIIVETTLGLFFIISKLSRRSDVQLISVEPQRGSLRCNNVPGRDLFDTIQGALSYLESAGHTIKAKTTACAILGYFAIENMGCLLIATKVIPEKMFFGDHIVNAVAESSWIKIPLSYPYPQNKAELKNFETLSSFQVDGLHYYCETFDLTRPFPSSRPSSDYVQEFCWNDWLAKSFADIGMRDWCPVLLQGTFKSKYIPESEMSLSLITRKSNAHPGTRFFARGLNENGQPGNETECEIILWSPQKDDLNSRWCSHVWRRGTVPVWWKSEPKKGVGDPEITVRKEKPFEGCEKYISSLLDTFGQPLYILSLLRTDPTKGELTLSQHYHQALQYVKHFMSIDVTILDYDWHANIKQLGNDKTIESFWDITKHPLERVNISEGSMLL